MTAANRPTTEELSKVRKCPRHKAWIQSMRVWDGGHYIRYCPRCDLERLQEQMLQEAKDAEAGIVKPKLIIKTI